LIVIDSADSACGSGQSCSSLPSLRPNGRQPGRAAEATSRWAHLSQRCSSPSESRSSELDLSRSRLAQSPCGAAGALTVLTFRYCSAQIFLFGTEFAKAIADERAPANTQGREERFTKA